MFFNYDSYISDTALDYFFPNPKKGDEYLKAARINAPRSISFVDLDIPQPGEKEVLIRVMASGICGTDVHIYEGDYLGEYPIIPGHEFSGIVTKTGFLVSRFKEGDRVSVEPNISCGNCQPCLNNKQNFCQNWQAIGVTMPGAMSEYVLVPEEAVFNIGQLPFEHAAFMEPLSCVLHGIGKCRIEPGYRVAILGSGPIGLLLLQASGLKGAAYQAVAEKNSFRLEKASSFGADALYPSVEDMEEDSFDLVIDATGSIPVMTKTIDLAAPGGEILFFGVPAAKKEIHFEPFLLFRKGLTVRSSYTSLRNSLQAISLLSSGKIKSKELISHRLPLKEIESGLQMVKNGSDNVMKVIIEPGKNLT